MPGWPDHQQKRYRDQARRPVICDSAGPRRWWFGDKIGRRPPRSSRRVGIAPVPVVSGSVPPAARSPQPPVGYMVVNPAALRTWSISATVTGPLAECADPAPPASPPGIASSLRGPEVPRRPRCRGASVPDQRRDQHHAERPKKAIWSWVMAVSRNRRICGMGRVPPSSPRLRPQQKRYTPDGISPGGVAFGSPVGSKFGESAGPGAVTPRCLRTQARLRSGFSFDLANCLRSQRDRSRLSLATVHFAPITVVAHRDKDQLVHSLSILFHPP